MKYILHTDIILLCLSKRHASSMVPIIRTLPKESIYISCISHAEVKTICSITSSRHCPTIQTQNLIKNTMSCDINTWLMRVVGSVEDRILPIDQNVWLMVEEFLPKCKGTITIDGLIAAQSFHYKATIVSSLVSDFQIFGARVLNPFCEESREQQSITFN